jgi:hypothetical protein
MARRLFVLLVPLALLAGACSKDHKQAAGVTTTTTSTTEAAPSSTSTTSAPGTTETAPTSTTTPAGSGIRMTGPTGSGTVAYTLAADRSEFCYRITVKGIGAPSAATLRRATGEVVLALQAPPTDGTTNSCSATDALTIEELQGHPANFAVQVDGAKGTLKATLRSV